MKKPMNYLQNLRFKLLNDKLTTIELTVLIVIIVLITVLVDYKIEPQLYK